MKEIAVACSTTQGHDYGRVVLQELGYRQNRLSMTTYAHLPDFFTCTTKCCCPSVSAEKASAKRVRLSNLTEKLV